jgi:hypothetical protein
MSWLDSKPVEEVVAAEHSLRASEVGERYIMDYAGGDVRFGVWLRLVDARLGKSLGIGHRDLSDWTWRDAFDDGLSPKEAAVAALEADDSFLAFFGGQE